MKLYQVKAILEDKTCDYILAKDEKESMDKFKTKHNKNSDFSKMIIDFETDMV